MRLAPRQLQRAGMTGNVPYYGGRMTPVQAYAAEHGSTAPPAAPPVQPVQPPKPHVPPVTPEQTMASLRQLRDDGLLSETEFTDLMARVSS